MDLARFVYFQFRFWAYKYSLNTYDRYGTWTNIANTSGTIIGSGGIEWNAGGLTCVVQVGAKCALKCGIPAERNLAEIGLAVDANFKHAAGQTTATV